VTEGECHTIKYESSQSPLIKCRSWLGWEWSVQ